VNHVLQKVINRDPVFTGGFHTNVMAVVFKKPCFEFKNTFVESGKAFLLIGRKDTVVDCSNDCGDEKRLVNINATADMVDNSHNTKGLLSKIQEAIDCPAAPLSNCLNNP
jgi:hypothetical protein